MSHTSKVIDEAYSLGDEKTRNDFEKECIDTLNQKLTETKYVRYLRERCSEDNIHEMSNKKWEYGRYIQYKVMERLWKDDKPDGVFRVEFDEYVCNMRNKIDKLIEDDEVHDTSVTSNMLQNTVIEI